MENIYKSGAHNILFIMINCFEAQNQGAEYTELMHLTHYNELFSYLDIVDYLFELG